MSGAFSWAALLADHSAKSYRSGGATAGEAFYYVPPAVCANCKLFDIIDNGKFAS